eukprot:scaffold875_cov183-Ochromonas_danica.AAC.3
MAYEKSLTKEKCNLCQMYYHRATVCYKVPNHRLLDIQKQWWNNNTKKNDRNINGASSTSSSNSMMMMKTTTTNQAIESENALKTGKRYENPSYLYQVTTVCSFCSQFFTQFPEDCKEDPNRDGGYQILPPVDNNNNNNNRSGSIGIDGSSGGTASAIQRQNIALNQRAYHSSEVDHKAAYLALLPPFEQSSRTRREADPWWEIEFGRFYHVHSLSFRITIGVRQRLEVHVLLLKKPIGFEDPFLDSVTGQAALEKIFICEAKGKRRVEWLEWLLPDHSQCYAIRIQLRGIHTLSLAAFQAFQGDDLILSSSLDRTLSTQSLASLSLDSIKTGLKDMLSPQKKFQKMEHRPVLESYEHRAFDTNACVDAVAKLSHQIQVRYNHVDEWKKKVLDAIKIFPDAEILALYRIIFKFVADTNIANAGRQGGAHEYDLLSSGLIAHYPRCDLTELHQRIRSVMRWIQTRSHLKVLGSLLDSEALSSVANSPSDQLYHLMSAFKRVEYYWNKCEQREQFSAIVEEASDMNGFMVQPKTNEYRERKYARRRVSGLPIMNDEASLQSLASNEGRSVSSYSLSIMKPNPVLGGQVSFKSGPSVDALTQRAQSSRLMSRRQSRSPGSPSMENGSLSQTWSVASSNFFPNASSVSRTNKSLSEAIRDDGFIPFDSNFAEYKFNHMKKKLSRDIAFPKHLSLEFAKSLLSRKGATISTFISDDLMLGGQLEAPSLSATDRDDESRNSATSSITGIESVELPSVPLPNRLNRMSSMQKSMRMSMDSTEMASNPILKSLKSVRDLSRASTAGSMLGNEISVAFSSSKNIKEAMAENNGGIATSSPKPAPLKKAMSSKSLRSQDKRSTKWKEDDDLDDLFSEEASHLSHKEVSKELTAVDFHRLCALCELRFPRSAVEMQVLRKHIVTLRTSWDPNLVSKEVRSLDNTISMYNLVYVCVFCAQFFDPDFPDGIAYPTRLSSRQASRVSTSSSLEYELGSADKILGQLQSSQNVGADGMIPFYDARHQPLSIEVGEVFKRPETVEARQRAQRAREVAEEQTEKQRMFQERQQQNEELTLQLTMH